MIKFNKIALLEKALNQLQEKKDLLLAAALEAKEASTHEESKAENKYDTRGLEASYLASGQAKMVKQLSEDIFNLKKVKPNNFTKDMPISMTALVHIFSEESRRWFFLIPASGIQIETESEKIQTLSINSPMGQLLIGAREGDSFELNDKDYNIEKIL